ncbi:MAG: chromosome partitioning protein ParB [Flavobacteriales bacterium]|nr:chromosome partitioning protein ParB [Flavobacteriales bacterium]|tara:strand:- start:749 stop:1651 length:903 start_codon:yes stop_codon:yes gene_type:complete
MKKENALGRGLSTILSNEDTDITSNEISNNKLVGNISHIKLSEITTNPFQPRNYFDTQNLEELAKSIDELGIIQPITVRKLGYDRYQLISGERRFKASKIACLDKIPAYIRIANDQEMLEIALVENIQRENLNPIEIALSYQKLIKECSLTQEKCSQRVGKKRSTIANFLGLLKLPEEIQSALKTKKISMGKARALINIKNKEKQLNIFHDAIANQFSVREIEQIVKEFKDYPYKRISKNRHPNTNYLNFKTQQQIFHLNTILDNSIDIKQNKKGDGKIIIKYQSEEELKKLLNKLNNLE